MFDNRFPNFLRGWCPAQITECQEEHRLSGITSIVLESLAHLRKLSPSFFHIPPPNSYR